MQNADKFIKDHAQALDFVWKKHMLNYPMNAAGLRMAYGAKGSQIERDIRDFYMRTRTAGADPMAEDTGGGNSGFDSWISRINKIGNLGADLFKTWKGATKDTTDLKNIPPYEMPATTRAPQNALAGMDLTTVAIVAGVIVLLIVILKK